MLAVVVVARDAGGVGYCWRGQRPPRLQGRITSEDCIYSLNRWKMVGQWERSARRRDLKRLVLQKRAGHGILAIAPFSSGRCLWSPFFALVPLRVAVGCTSSILFLLLFLPLP